MTDVKLVDKDVRKIFCRKKDNITRILITALNDIPTCQGNHLALIKAARDKMFWYKRFQSFCQIILAVFMLIIIFTIIGMWFLRSYNHANRFGGCSVNFFVPFEECPIAF